MRWNHHSFAHKLVAELQIQMAHQVYDELASKPHGEGDRFHAEVGETEFVNKIAPQLRDQARAILTDMLARPDVPQAEKDEIYDALLLDRVIPNEDRWHVPQTNYPIQ